MMQNNEWHHFCSQANSLPGVKVCYFHSLELSFSRTFASKPILLIRCFLSRAVARIPKTRRHRGGKVSGGGVPLHPLLIGKRSGRGQCPSPENFFILDLKMSTSSASCVPFFCSSATYCTSKNTTSGLTKIAAACTQTLEFTNKIHWSLSLTQTFVFSGSPFLIDLWSYLLASLLLHDFILVSVFILRRR